MSAPRFEDLVPAETDAAERTRLRRAHDALVAAGPPPELPTRLRLPPEPAAARFPPRRVAALGLAAALALAAFAGGYALGDDDGPAFATDFVVPMEGTAAAPDASASLVVGEIDEAGNWPMTLDVEGLPFGRYELLLTRGGRPVESCGRFLVEGGAVAYLNAPYRLRDYDGWVVVAEGTGEIVLATDEV